jgi:Raf kinase inhibitor-like YbhB/YbcL family protein
MKTIFTAMLLLAVTATAQEGGFILGSPGIQDKGALPMAQVGNRNGCTGANLSPALTWQGLPNGTRSLAVTVFDPDARKGDGFWHWVMFNIPPTAPGLSEGAGRAEASQLAGGVAQLRNEAGSFGYTGACPPQGDEQHHYVITLWALKVPVLPLNWGVSGAAIQNYLAARALGKATLTAVYGR